MKLTITIEEEKESEVRIERQSSGAAAMPAEGHPAEPAVTNAGEPSESLLAELGQRSPTPAATETGDAIDGGSAPASLNGAAAIRI